MRPNCEWCDGDLPADKEGALICSFECTWCAACNERELRGQCPNCKGPLLARPTRSAVLLAKYPASTKRIISGPGRS